MSNTSGFVAGTLVHTDKGLVPIEQLKVGDKVLSKSQNDPDGELSYQRVVKTFSFDEKKLRAILVYSEVTEQFECFVMTYNHSFWVEGEGWTAAKAVTVNHDLQFKDREDRCYVMRSWPLFKTRYNKVAWLSVDPTNALGMHIDLNGDHVCFEEGILSQFGKNKHLLHYIVPVGEDEVYDEYTDRVYNFELEGTHTYYVGNHGVWVHDTN